MKPNNVTRMLDAKKIPYTAFELPDEKIGAVETARLLGASQEQVFKTIVVTRRHPGKPILAVVPGPEEVNLKALAKVVGEKKVYLATKRDAERLTGLKAGGISPLALTNRGFQVVLDASARSCAEIYISGGQRGLNLLLPTKALIDLTKAIVAKIGG